MKIVEGFEDYYVTLCGKVVSKKFHYNQNPNCELRTLKPLLDKDGYYITSLYSNRKPNTKKIHRLVAQAFIPNPENKPQVNHKNGVKTDCRVSNLEWSTGKENMQHAYDTGLRVASPSIGIKNNNAKLTEKEVLLIRLDSRNNQIIAKDYNVSSVCIGLIKSNKTWKHLL